MTCGLAINPSSVQTCDNQVWTHARFARIPSIGAQCQQEEHHAQQVLALGNPRHRLDVDRVQREKRSDHRAAACVSGCPPQHPEQQHHVDDVQQQVRLVMPARIQIEQLAIQRVREPGQGMPVRGVQRRKAPLDGLPAQTRLHLRVVQDIDVVVVVQERMAG